MGDIQAQAFAIVVDGRRIAVVESQAIAEEVLQSVKDLYVSKKSSRKYEEIAFKEDVKIEQTSTTLAKISSKYSALKKIKSGKKYYVRVRAYATYKDKNNVTQKVYSRWNKKIRKVTVK